MVVTSARHGDHSITYLHVMVVTSARHGDHSITYLHVMVVIGVFYIVEFNNITHPVPLFRTIYRTLAHISYTSTYFLLKCFSN